ncbi:response regulator transcription factor [Aliikangiella coralliicola]|uniref:Response regulator transcription factor n=1 Tax=Aliikangiella coralliicola TaxID=2592383 RepID=A0A545UJX7_9GAMM|nr:response regulator transcription factor [Aliikangiella coralliicola]TQV89768.1 response regulator transcription factor [Aliikangiella coralliicola]
MKSLALNILVIEDQTTIAKNIADFMEAKGHILDFADDGKRGLSLALSNFYDVIVLDLMLPGMDGWEVCREIRQASSRHVPILMLTARDSLTDKVKGFELGADDYLTKPFALEELLVRCLALSRRNQLQTEHVIQIGSLQIDRKSQKVKRGDNLINLNQIPYSILLTLAEAYPRVVSRSELCQRIWGDDLTESDSLRSHIYQLRQNLDKPFEKPMIKTVHGVGFSLEPDE